MSTQAGLVNVLFRLPDIAATAQKDIGCDEIFRESANDFAFSAHLWNWAEIEKGHLTV